MKNVITAVVLTAMSHGASGATSSAAFPAPPSWVWRGDGAVYTIHHKLLSQYTLEVTVTPISTTQEQMVVEVRDNTGVMVHQDRCQSTQTAKDAWTKVCSGGTSHGNMLDATFGLGYDYYEAVDGKAYATTIVIDNPSTMRLFRYELVNGGATKFFVERLHRISNEP